MPDIHIIPSGEQWNIKVENHTAQIEDQIFNILIQHKTKSDRNHTFAKRR